jgi:putative DNA primase/helicase
VPIAGTLAETYLRERGFADPPPPTIRFLPSYRYSRENQRRLPCLMAAAQAPTREIVAVQLTFLDPTGRRKADVEEPRRSIGPLGTALLRTAPAAEHLGLAEGFETAWGATLLHDRMPVWATLGSERYGVIRLPPIVKRVTIFADHDAAGLASALAFFERNPSLDVWLSWPRAVGWDFARLWELMGGSGDACPPRAASAKKCRIPADPADASAA